MKTKYSLRIVMTLLISTLLLGGRQAQWPLIAKLKELGKFNRLNKLNKVDDLYKIKSNKGLSQLHIVGETPYVTLDMNMKKFMNSMNDQEKNMFQRIDRSTFVNKNNIIKIFDSYNSPYDLEVLLNKNLKSIDKFDTDAFLKLVKNTERPWGSQKKNCYILVKSGDAENAVEILPISIRARQDLIRYIDIHSSDILDSGKSFSIFIGLPIIDALENEGESSGNELQKTCSISVSPAFSSDAKILQRFLYYSSAMAYQLSINSEFKHTEEFKELIYIFTLDLLSLYADQYYIDQEGYSNEALILLGYGNLYQTFSVQSLNGLTPNGTRLEPFPVNIYLENFIGKLIDVGTKSDTSFFSAIYTSVINQAANVNTIAKVDYNKLTLIEQVDRILMSYRQSE